MENGKLDWYLAGPMTGLPEYNYPEFSRVSRMLRSQGFLITSPHELHGGDTDRPYTWYLKRGIRALTECDGIILMQGYAQSLGARTELRMALIFAMPVGILTPHGRVAVARQTIGLPEDGPEVFATPDYPTEETLAPLGIGPVVLSSNGRTTTTADTTADTTTLGE